jgi:hypothetical protein
MDDDDNKDKRDKVGPISGLRRKMTRRLSSASGDRSKMMKREKTLERRQGFRPGEDSDTRLLAAGFTFWYRRIYRTFIHGHESSTYGRPSNIKRSE